MPIKIQRISQFHKRGGHRWGEEGGGGRKKIGNKRSWMHITEVSLQRRVNQRLSFGINKNSSRFHGKSTLRLHCLLIPHQAIVKFPTLGRAITFWTQSIFLRHWSCLIFSYCRTQHQSTMSLIPCFTHREFRPPGWRKAWKETTARRRCASGLHSQVTRDRRRICAFSGQTESHYDSLASSRG